MATLYTADKVENPTRTVTISDYDELSEESQRALRQLAAGKTVQGVTIDSDIVRFTDYYRIEPVEARASD